VLNPHGRGLSHYDTLQGLPSSRSIYLIPKSLPDFHVTGAAPITKGRTVEWLSLRNGLLATTQDRGYRKRDIAGSSIARLSVRIQVGTELLCFDHTCSVGPAKPLESPDWGTTRLLRAFLVYRRIRAGETAPWMLSCDPGREADPRFKRRLHLPMAQREY
jgi:hypothetical protein